MYLIWLKHSLKRALKALPLFMLTFALCIAISAASLKAALKSFSGILKPDIKIGIVSVDDEKKTRYIIKLLSDMKSVKNSMTFSVMSEKNADERLDSGELTAVVKIPKDFISSVMDGRNIPAVICTSSARPVEGAVIRELTEALSKLVSVSQSYIYASYDEMKRIGAPDEAERKLNEKINVNFISESLSRERYFKEELTQTPSFNSMAAASSALLSMWLTSTGAAKLLKEESDSLIIQMRRAGFSPFASAAANLLKAAICLSVCAVLICAFAVFKYEIELASAALLFCSLMSAGIFSACILGLGKDSSLTVPVVFVTGFTIHFLSGGFIPELFVPKAVRLQTVSRIFVKPVASILDGFSYTGSHLVFIAPLAASALLFLAVYTLRRLSS